MAKSNCEHVAVLFKAHTYMIPVWSVFFPSLFAVIDRMEVRSSIGSLKQ